MAWTIDAAGTNNGAISKVDKTKNTVIGRLKEKGWVVAINGRRFPALLFWV